MSSQAVLESLRQLQLYFGTVVIVLSGPATVHASEKPLYI